MAPLGAVVSVGTRTLPCPGCVGELEVKRRAKDGTMICFGVPKGTPNCLGS